MTDVESASIAVSCARNVPMLMFSYTTTSSAVLGKIGALSLTSVTLTTRSKNPAWHGEFTLTAEMRRV
jgi:hypothetical protein